MSPTRLPPGRPVVPRTMSSEAVHARRRFRSDLFSSATPRGWGSTGLGLCVLHEGPTYLEYTRPSSSSARPSWSRPARGETQSGAGANYDHRDPAQTAVRERWGGPVTEAPGSATRTPGSLLRGPVSTALTSTSLPPKRPARIVGILRFLPSTQRRCTRDVSTMDTDDLPGPARPLPFGPSSPPGPPACPGFPPERVSQKS